jgi:hypothetical protein
MSPLDIVVAGAAIGTVSGGIVGGLLAETLIARRANELGCILLCFALTASGTVFGAAIAKSLGA